MLTPRLHIEDHGTGEPVLLITGWTISAAVFDPMLPLLTPRLRVVAYDHRGSGRSGAWPAPVSMAMLAADAVRVLDDRGIRAAHVVGVSMGGVVALELALRFGHRVRSLALCGAGAAAPEWTPRSATAAARATTQVVRDSVAARRPWPAALLFSDAFRAAEPERVRELTRPFGAHRAPPWTAWTQFVAFACFDRLDALHRVRAPTLVVHGERDVMVPPAAARRLAAGIPGAELHVVPGAGHAAPLERPEETAELLLEWVGRHAGTPLPGAPGALGRLGERATRPLALHLGARRAWWRAVGRAVAP